MTPRSLAVQLALSKTRAALNAIQREWNTESEDGEVGVALCTELQQVQTYLRAIAASGQMIDPVVVIKPYLSLLRAATLSGPYKLLALDTLQQFLRHDVLTEYHSAARVTQALDELVSSIIKCKYVQTDAAIDEQAQVQLVATLRILFSPALLRYLPDSVAWTAVESLHATVIQAASAQKHLLFRFAEQALLSAVQASCSPCAPTAILPLNTRLETVQNGPNSDSSVATGLDMTVSEVADSGETSNGGAQSAESEVSSPVLPCALSILQFYVGIIQKHSLPDSAAASRAAASVASHLKQAKRTSVSTAWQHRVSSTGLASGLGPDMCSLLLALQVVLKILHTAAAEGPPLNGPHPMGTKDCGETTATPTMLLAPELVNLLRGELACCLIQLTRQYGYPSVVMQMLLDIFSSMYAVLGPVSKGLVECFVKFVYLRALQEALALLRDDGNILVRGIAPASGNSSQPASIGQVQTQVRLMEEEHTHAPFSEEQICAVLESLHDLLANAGFLTTLFASFDCDCAREDLVQPLLHLMGQCEWYSSMNTYKAPVERVRLLCQQCMTQVVQSLSAAHSSSRSSTSASSDNVDTSSSGGKGWSSSGGDINRTPASGGSAPNAAPVDEDERVSTIADSISASRQTKIILTRASQLFSERPELGFDYLQTHGLLTKPLTPNSVAKFLRISPRLSIEKIGAYLGELGTKNARHESASVEFHKQVLSDYIKSFEFTGQSLLDAVRIFLSAFLLPKEAQQIDRIFVAFAEHCHQSCAECVSGVLQNSDVTYLMTISIIMLNTDRHNANIPPHKKMTLQKFVQVNKNYGADLKQTQDVPVTYLEKIFHSIDQFPLRTDRNDLLSQHAVKHFSVAVWQDMQLQQSIFPERGFLTTASFAPALLEGFSREFAHASDSKGGKSHKHGTEAYEDIRNVGKSMLLNNSRVNPLVLSAAVSGKHWIFHQDILTCVWGDVLLAMCAPFVGLLAQFSGKQLQAQALAQASAQAQMCMQAVIRSLAIAEALVTLSALHSLPIVADTVVTLLADFSGAGSGRTTNRVLAGLGVPPRLALDEMLLRSTNAAAVDFLLRLHYSFSARAALWALLRAAQSSPHVLRRAWTTVWEVLGRLRDVRCLPVSMVADGDADVLPPLIRAAFETRLQEAAVTDTECSPGKSEPSSPKPQQGTRRGSLLGYLFGSDSLEDGMSEAASEVRGRDSAEALARVKASRWDAGYEALIAAGEGDDGDSGRPALLLRDPYGLHVFPTLPVSGDLSEILWGGVGSASLAALDGGKSGEGNLLVTPNSADKDQEKRTKEDTVMDRSSRTSAALATQRLRRGVREAGATSLVSDTRFYSVPALVLALQALSDCATCGCLESAELSMQVAVTAGSASASEQLAEILQTSAEDAGRAAPSAASRAWFEQLLSEAVVRNRDRIGALWPILERHYSLQLRPPRFGLTYGTERALVGLLKVAERVLARQGVAEPMMALFGRLFQAPAPMVIEAVTVKVAAPTRMLRQEEEPVLRELAGHVSSGVWRLLTKNVDVLPLLTSVQWDVLFHLLAISASASAYAAVKVFESLAWLLHEPRLRANVPLTVTQCVVPLVLNRRAPSTVSTGAVQLLLRLHERLEVFATDAAVARSALPEQDAEHLSQTLWDSSWVPLLTALVAGVQRRRGRVQRASVRALERTLRDRHALAAPPRVLMWVLAGLLVPTVQQLATQRSTRRKSGRTQTPSSQYLHDNEQGELISDANEETSSIASEEENDESQQQWELGASLGSESPVPSSIVVTPVRDAVHRALHSLGDAGVDSGEAMEDPLCVVLATLSEAFVRQPKKLAAYPSFDQLWLRLLQLLSLLLGPEEEEACTTEPPSGPEGSAGLGRAWVSLTPAAEAALHSLQSCLAALHSAGLLQQKQGLRVVSREMVRGMSLLQRVAATDAQTAAALALL